MVQHKPTAQTAKGKGKGKSDDDKAKMDVTIYLPNRDSIEIVVYGGNTVDTVIRDALRHHEDHSILPALLYDQPSVYDLRTHEEDGFPGDFTLGRNKLIKEFTEYERILRKDRSGYDDIAVNEFCLVETEVGRRKASIRSSPISPR